MHTRLREPPEARGPACEWFSLPFSLSRSQQPQTEEPPCTVGAPAFLGPSRGGGPGAGAAWTVQVHHFYVVFIPRTALLLVAAAGSGSGLDLSQWPRGFLSGSVEHSSTLTLEKCHPLRVGVSAPSAPLGTRCAAPAPSELPSGTSRLQSRRGDRGPRNRGRRQLVTGSARVLRVLLSGAPRGPWLCKERKLAGRSNRT